MSEEKAKRAAEMLRNAGIKSAKSSPGGAYKTVEISPEDAMKMLLLTGEDVGRVLKSEERIRFGIRSQISDLKDRLARLEKMAKHSPELCAKGEHITESYATGGRSGHCVTRCLVCDFRQEGWD